jgi:hypothetical protein
MLLVVAWVGNMRFGPSWIINHLIVTVLSAISVILVPLV